VEKLRGAKVEASDLRAGAALVLAGLAAKGETTVKNIHFIDRGYEAFEDTLTQLGANIRRVQVPDETLATDGAY
jgi:UDP-N-acetylglucosamine 1-carboxyvinyltransferase